MNLPSPHPYIFGTSQHPSIRAFSYAFRRGVRGTKRGDFVKLNRLTIEPGFPLVELLNVAAIALIVFAFAL
jgi:hypothetical protein